jgi:hypothetical protein
MLISFLAPESISTAFLTWTLKSNSAINYENRNRHGGGSDSLTDWQRQRI